MRLVVDYRFPMQPSSNLQIPERYLHALNIVLAEIETFTTPVGILLTGSVVHGNASATSDLDVAMLHDETWRQRIQRVVDGVPVECFINSEAWWLRTLDSEAASGRSPAAHFLSRGVIWRDTDNRMRDLQRVALTYVERGPRVSENALVTLQYGAVSTLEDGSDIATLDEDRARWLLYEAIEKALHYYYQHNRIWIPREKDLFIDLEQRWPELGAFVRRAYAESGVVALSNIASDIVCICTGRTRFFDWSSTRQELDPS